MIPQVWPDQVYDFDLRPSIVGFAETRCVVASDRTSFRQISTNVVTLCLSLDRTCRKLGGMIVTREPNTFEADIFMKMARWSLDANNPTGEYPIDSIIGIKL